MEERIKILENLPGALLPWYQKARRDLPWRKDRDPYHVWVSEIMLQQTRVEAVKGYYDRFLKAIPHVQALASAEDDLLRKLWEGLGYYSRVRNLKKAANVIVDAYDGVFPGDYDQIRSLPGIGDYTAGAIASICFDKSTPAVDGNVLRVVSRLLADDTPIDSPAVKKQVSKELAAVYPPQTGEFTQALMELGATVCGPNKDPDCGNCPCRSFCKGHLEGVAEKLPVRLPKKIRRQEDMTVLILSCDGKIALEKRPEEGLLGGLWQFPNVSGKLDAPGALQYLQEQGMMPKDLIRIVERKHIFTHIQWNMTGIYMEMRTLDPRCFWFSLEQIKGKIPLPTAFRKFIEGI